MTTIKQREAKEQYSNPANSAQSHTSSPSMRRLDPNEHKEKSHDQSSQHEEMAETNHTDTPTPRVSKIRTKTSDSIALLLYKFEELDRRISKQEGSLRTEPLTALNRSQRESSDQLTIHLRNL
ncbi:hypothetical protein ACLB2K_007124 [Fragaria x ananassa]